MARKNNQAFLEEKEYINKFLNGKCEEVMKRLPSESVDLIVTSPPYNLRNSTGNGMKDGRGGKWANAALLKGYAEAEYTDNLPHEEYVAWQRECITEMMRLLKPNGALFYNHKWRVQAGLLQDRADIVSGFPVRQIIIWRRNGGINFNKGYFLPTYEVIYMIAKKDFILAKGANSYGDIWEFGQEQKNEHPAPFPVALIERVISSTNAEIVLDPFMGSGTTAIAATKQGRKFVGIELSENYIKLAKNRLKNLLNEPVDEDKIKKKQNNLFD
jgi:site-specific DNA-methyltransferase (adenine-specific)